MGLNIATYEVAGIHVVAPVGDIAGDGVVAFDAACAAAGRPLVVDLRELITLDAKAVTVLRDRMAAGTMVHNATPFVAVALGLTSPRQWRA